MAARRCRGHRGDPVRCRAPRRPAAAGTARAGPAPVAAGPVFPADRFLPDDDPQWPGHWASPPREWVGADLADEQALAQVRAAIRAMPPELRQVIVLRDVERALAGAGARGAGHQRGGRDGDAAPGARAGSGATGALPRGEQLMTGDQQDQRCIELVELLTAYLDDDLDTADPPGVRRASRRMPRMPGRARPVADRGRTRRPAHHRGRREPRPIPTRTPSLHVRRTTSAVTPIGCCHEHRRTLVIGWEAIAATPTMPAHADFPQPEDRGATPGRTCHDAPPVPSPQSRRPVPAVGTDPPIHRATMPRRTAGGTGCSPTLSSCRARWGTADRAH